jgi:hypothetical protein
LLVSVEFNGRTFEGWETLVKTTSPAFRNDEIPPYDDVVEARFALGRVRDGSLLAVSSKSLWDISTKIRFSSSRPSLVQFHRPCSHTMQEEAPTFVNTTEINQMKKE